MDRRTCLAGLALALMATAGLAEPLTLRLNDAVGVPDGMVAVVFRTYTPVGIGQGQICFRAVCVGNVAGRVPACRLGVNDGPFASLESFEVFSELDDALSTASFDPETQTIDLMFVSASGTVNWSDGPLAVLYFRLTDTTQPGEVYQLGLDAAETFLFTANGAPIPIEPRGGELDVVAPGGPLELGLEGGAFWAGYDALIGLETAQISSFSSGQATILYDPQLLDGQPEAAVDPRFGHATASVDASVPGELVVSFETVGDGETLGRLPGQFLSIAFPLDAGLPIGTTFPITLDEAGTELVGPTGSIPLALEGDVLEILEPPIFLDGFESGDLSAWTASTL